MNTSIVHNVKARTALLETKMDLSSSSAMNVVIGQHCTTMPNKSKSSKKSKPIEHDHKEDRKLILANAEKALKLPGHVILVAGFDEKGTPVIGNIAAHCTGDAAINSIVALIRTVKSQAPTGISSAEILTEVTMRLLMR